MFQKDHSSNEKASPQLKDIRQTYNQKELVFRIYKDI